MIMNKIKRKFKMWLDFILKEHKQDIENFLKNRLHRGVTKKHYFKKNQIN